MEIRRRSLTGSPIAVVPFLEALPLALRNRSAIHHPVNEFTAIAPFRTKWGRTSGFSKFINSMLRLADETKLAIV